MLKRWLFTVDLWLFTGQLEHYFRLSCSCFSCPWQTDNQNFEHCSEDTKHNGVITHGAQRLVLAENSEMLHVMHSCAQCLSMGLFWAYLKSWFPKPLTSTPTCYSFADQVTAKKPIFNTKFTANGKCWY